MSEENTNYEEIAQAMIDDQARCVFVLGTPRVRDADTSILVEFAHPVSPHIGSPQRALTSTPTAGPFYLANRFTSSHGKFAVSHCIRIVCIVYPIR
jgi:hypothetical protein